MSAYPGQAGGSFYGQEASGSSASAHPGVASAYPKPATPPPLQAAPNYANIPVATPVPTYAAPSAPTPKQAAPTYEAPKAPPPKLATPAYDAPKAPPPAMQYEKPTTAPPTQRMATPPTPTRGGAQTAAEEAKLLLERQAMLQKFRDVGDNRGKGMGAKALNLLQYDQVEINVEGNDSSQEKVFDVLVEGETILHTLDCYIRQKRRSRFYLCCCTIFTLGLYMVYMLCCVHFRARKCGNTRVTLGITSLGRLIYWHADTFASKRSFPMEVSDTDAQTYRRFFHMKEVNMVQFKFEKAFDVFDENDADEQDYSTRPTGHLRLFCGKFPTVTYSAEDWVTTPSRKLQVEEIQRAMAPNNKYVPPEDCFVKYGEMVLRVYDAINLAYDLIVIVRGMLEFSVINFIRFFFLVFRNVLNAYRLALYGAIDPLDNVDVQDRCIDVYVHDDDEFSKESVDGVYNKLVAFNNALLQMRSLKSSMNCDKVNEPHWHFTKGQPGELLKRVDQSTGQDRGIIKGTMELGTSSVAIHEDEIPLVEGEYIIDAYGEYTYWRDFDFFKTLITFGFYWLVYLRRQFNKKKAVILTNKRLIQVMKAGELRNRLPVYGSTVYEIDIKWWALEGCYAGLVRQQALTAIGEIATKQGVVRITLQQMQTHFLQRPTLKKQVEHRFRTFLFAASGAVSQPLVKDPSKYGLSNTGSDPRRHPQLPPSMLPLMPIKGEVVLASFHNANLYSNWECGEWTECCFCGFKPSIMDGRIVVSTHRYMAAVHPHIKPYCCGDYMIKEEFMWLWGKLDEPKNFQGWSLQGNVKDHTIICDCCGFFTPNRTRANKNSTVDFVMMAHGARPVQLRMKHLGKPQGHLEEPHLMLLRQVMNTLMVQAEGAKLAAARAKRAGGGQEDDNL